MSAERRRDVDRPKQRRLRAPVRRERILEAALRLFAEEGYGASIGDIAKAAGITRTVLYYYFPTKRELFLAVLEQPAAELLGRLTPLVRGEGSRTERARALFEVAVAFAEEEPLGWDMLFRRGDDDEVEVRQARQAVFETAKASFVALIRPEMDRRRFDPDGVSEQIAVEGGLGAIFAVVDWWREHPAVSRQELTEATFDLFWNGISGIVEVPELPAEH